MLLVRAQAGTALFGWHFCGIYLHFKYIYSLTQRFHFQKFALKTRHISMQDYISQRSLL